jgi:hypothetical protein
MKADIKIRPLIKLIPSGKFTFSKHKKFWFKYSLYFDFLIFTIDIDNF